MTDEEKAKKIANKKCHKMFCYTLCNVNKNHHCGEWHYNKECALEGIEYGLAEGRKEKCLEQNNDGTIRPCEVMKENETLTKRILELQKTCGTLTDKVEKMKCCTTCVNHTFYILQVDRLVKGKDDTKCKNCIHYSLNKLENYRKGKELVDNWELVE